MNFPMIIELWDEKDNVVLVTSSPKNQKTRGFLKEK